MPNIEAWPGIGPPTKGRHRENDIAVDSAGTIFRCIVRGRPGTFEQEGGGSGASVTTRAHYWTTGITVPPNTWFNPNWTLDTVSHGGTVHADPLLDLTDPANPVVVAAGIYVVSAEFKFGNDRQAGKSYYCEIDMDANADDANVATNQSLDPVNSSLGATDIQAALSITYYVPAGGVINAAVQHNRTSDATHFDFSVWLQRIA